MTDKTIADVIDHGIDKLSGGAAELAKAARQVAPHAWELAVRQQVISGCLDLLLGGSLAALFIYCLLLTRRRWSKMVDGAKQADFEPGPWIVLLFLIVTTWVSLCAAVNGVKHIASAEYFAAKAILEAVK